jgi:hypothetical protein
MSVIAAIPLRPVRSADNAAGSLFLGIDTSHDDAVVQRTEMHEHPPLQFSDVISPAASGPPGGNDLGAPKIRFKRAGENFSDAWQGYPDAGRETRGE